MTGQAMPGAPSHRMSSRPSFSANALALRFKSATSRPEFSPPGSRRAWMSGPKRVSERAK
jgi:hypothetical protein